MNIEIEIKIDEIEIEIKIDEIIEIETGGGDIEVRMDRWKSGIRH